MRPQAHFRQTSLRVLLAAAIASLAAYGAVAMLSREFDTESPLVERPIISVLACLALAFAAYLLALRAAIRIEQRSVLLWVVFVPSVLFRLVMVASLPIQEVDVYRYLWDGAVGATGISPYHYSPSQVLEWRDADIVERLTLPPDFLRLLSQLEQSAGLNDVLRLVHFPDLPTVYPPVSQMVFRAVAWMTPGDASVYVRLVLMKTVLVGFDLATAALIVGLLRAAGRHEGWVLAYAWCPLLIKEVAGSGHLDVIAVFFMTSATASAFRALFAGPVGRPERAAMCWLVVSALLLAAGVGAKLYPIVLVPLLLVASARRFGVRVALTATGVCLLTAGMLLAPMIPSRPADSTSGRSRAESRTAASRWDEVPRRQNPASGLEAFLRYWEMNDFLFMVLVENVTPETESARRPAPWFAVVPNHWRAAVVNPLARFARVDPENAAFLMTRFATSAIFLSVAIWLAWRPWPREDGSDWLQASFLTIAWFWLLSPTQNPWYWIWALPLIPFARSRLWLLVSGLALIYYLRFWLSYHWPVSHVPGLGYPGSLAFDYVVTWFEFGAWFFALVAEGVLKRGAGRSRTIADAKSRHHAEKN